MHKRLNRLYAFHVATACGRVQDPWVVNASWNWKRVTCKRCLKARRK
jgi:hypothetical protein